MKHTKTRYILSIALVFAVLVSHCSFEGLQMSGGTTTETTNGCVVGSLETIDGSPAHQTIVKLIESNYDPLKDGPVPDSLVNTTGEDGEFAFHIAGGGTFNIEGVRRSSGEGILITGVKVKDSDTTAIPTGTIRKTGSIKILLPTDIDAGGAYIYIRGTTRSALPDDTAGFALLESVPAGTTPPVYYAVTGSSAGPKTIADSVSVTPGVTTVIGYQTGAHSAKLVFNTTASGADIAGTVTNFPVLIRLREGNFDFAQAKADGGDLRFAKSNGAPLPYEIERWDPAARQAEVWVKVDTVFGNDSTHFFIMYWGDSAATNASNGTAVFDTGNGFAAVWHLDSDFSDATAGNHGGINFGATDTAGIIGGAKKFDGSSYIQVAGLLGAPPSITISAWVRLDSTSGSGQEIVSLGDAVAIRAYRTSPDGTAGFFCSKVSGSDTVHVFTNTGASILKTGWRYLVYTVDVARHVQSMYIDGTFQSSTNDSNPIDYGLGLNTVLGAHGNKKTQSYAFGCIDEARVCRVARSMDWIKLCYMNQKEQDALLKFR